METFYKDHHHQNLYFCDLSVEITLTLGINMYYVKGNIKAPVYRSKSADQSLITGLIKMSPS